jgi:sortase A
MKGKLYYTAIILIFAAGLSLLLYPTVSDFVNAWYHSQLISDYDQTVDEMEEYEYQAEWDAALAYNQALLHRSDMTALEGEVRELYYSMLSPKGQSVMGYLEIPAIGVTLSVAHGTSNNTLKNAVGHMEWSSLPVGGESSHCVVFAHRGLPSAELFTNLDHLEPGDLFYLHVLGQTLEYRVDNIAIVDPYDYTLLTIVEGKDYCTLVTCTPYGINSHRLLVRGVRVHRDRPEEVQIQLTNEVQLVDTGLIVVAILSASAALAFLGLLLLRKNEKRKDGNENV